MFKAHPFGVRPLNSFAMVRPDASGNLPFIGLIFFVTLMYFTIGCSDDEKASTTVEVEETRVYPALAAWQPGYLDIHHINTGRGDASFMVFPDGTTMLFDAGEEIYDRGPYKAHPDGTRSAGEWIAYYISEMMPAFRDPQVDYALISHFHHDHYGAILPSSQLAEGSYYMTGFTTVGTLLPFNKVIDRNYPDYNNPVDLRSYYIPDTSFGNYLQFLDYQQSANNLQIESMRPGVSDQIVLTQAPDRFPDFEVRNIKANEFIWTGEGENVSAYDFDRALVNESGKFNENPLSLVFRISYGDFDYYAGGDLPGFSGWPDFDIESRVGEVVGEVDAMALNHHGYKDATNSTFVATLKPTVAVHQANHDPHYQRGVLERLMERKPDVFTTNMNEVSVRNFSPYIREMYRNKGGHILIRVLPGGNDFYVYELDDDTDQLGVRQTFGPYTSKN